MIPYIIIFLVVGIVSKAIADYTKNARNEKVLKEMEKNQPKFNHFKILPFDVQELNIVEYKKGLWSLQFTPINVKQVEEEVFSIHVKSRFEGKVVEFEFIINNKIQEFRDQNIVLNYMNTWLHTDLKDSDLLIHILANIFNVELKSTEQINRDTILFVKAKDINIESIYEPHSFHCLFSSAFQDSFSPSIEISFDLKKGVFELREMDPLFRPIIIEKLLFRKNIKTY